MNNYTPEERKQIIEEFRKSKMFPLQFAQSKGLLITEFNKWLRESKADKTKGEKNIAEDFGIINIEIAPETPKGEDIGSTKGFKFENDTIKIELKENYDKVLLRTLFGVLVRMIRDLLNNISQIYIAYGYTDFRKQIDGLCNIVENKYKLNPYKKVAFLFCNRKRTSIKVLVYDRNGFILAQKKLLSTANMKFKWPKNSDEMKQITKEQLSWLLSGLTIEPKGYFRDIDIKQKKIAI